MERRNFLRTSALSLGALGLSGCHREEEYTEKKALP